MRISSESGGIQCGVCLKRLASRDFRRLYLTEIPGYPLGAPLRTFARVRICKGCWKEVLSGTAHSEARLRSLLEWTGAPAQS